MLEVDLEMEKGDIKNYQKHAQMAEELGYVELQIKPRRWPVMRPDMHDSYGVS